MIFRTWIWRLSGVLVMAWFLLGGNGRRSLADDEAIALDWRPLPDLPNELGVAGPFVGVHNGALIVAGGANFAPRPGTATSGGTTRSMC